jgi:hypothetical protein
MRDGGTRHRTLVNAGRKFLQGRCAVEIDLGGLLQLQKAAGDAGQQSKGTNATRRCSVKSIQINS